jgi:DNA-binding SARP family transcriptional activator
MGEPVEMRSGGRAEQLLTYLALQPRIGLSRATLAERIWPDTPLTLATQSLSTLLYSVKAQLADGLAGQPPVVRTQSRYALNFHGGVVVDVLEFESSVAAGGRLLSQGSVSAAIEEYEHAVALYGGDLTAGSDVFEMLECERLRVAFLATLGRLADAHFAVANYPQALECAQRLLTMDPCREDAHRMVMRAHVRLGSRAQAMRHYKLCRAILLDEFDASAEPATEQLFELIRVDPGQV